MELSIMKSGAGIKLYLIILSMAVILFEAARADPGEMEEFCHLDVFNATCPHGHVVMMTSARYGRMRVGRCLTTSYFIGCYADVLPFMDSECSGKRACSVKTVDSELLKFHPCRKDLMPYLEAKYECIQTQQWSPQECVNSKHVTVHQPSGYISVRLGHKSRIGTADCPWQVTAKLGQKVEFKLYRFAYNSDKTNSVIGEPEKCQHTVVFRDGTKAKQVSLCTGYTREESIYTTVHSKIQVYIQTASTAVHHKKSTVLLNYKAIGCADIAGHPDAEVRRTDGTAVVKCRNSQETWHLVCKDNEWIGEIRNCTRKTVTQGPNKSERNVSTEFRNKVQYGILIAVSVGLILGVFLGFTLLMCMAFYRRKKRRRKDSELESTRQNTLLCDYTDDKSQYASFLPANQYSAFMPRGQSHDVSHVMSRVEEEGEAELSLDNNQGHQEELPLAAGENHMTCSCDLSRVVPCDMVQDTQILESSGRPDVIYSPRIPLTGSHVTGSLMTCEACRTNQILHSIYAKAPARPNTSTNRNTSFMPLDRNCQSASSRQSSTQPMSGSYSVYDTLPSNLPSTFNPTRNTSGNSPQHSTPNSTQNSSLGVTYNPTLSSTYATLPLTLTSGRLPVVKETDPLNGNTSDYDSINSSNENRESEEQGQIVSV